MIYLKDIRTIDDNARIDENYAENQSFLEKMDAEAFLVRSQANSMSTFGIYTEEAKTRTENSFVKMCKKIGDKIIEIINRAKNFIADKYAQWKSAAWAKTSDEQKLRELERRNPSAAKQIKVAVKAGDLDFMSYSDFADFYKHVDEILDAISANNADAKTLRGRWEKIKHKYVTGDNIKTLMTVIGTTVTVVTAGVSIYKLIDAKKDAPFEKICKENQDKLTKAKLANEKIQKQINLLDLEAAKKKDKLNATAMNLAEIQNGINRNAAAAKADNYDVLRLLADITSTIEHVGNKELVGSMNLAQRISNALTSALNAGPTDIKTAQRKANQIIDNELRGIQNVLNPFGRL